MGTALPKHPDHLRPVPRNRTGPADSAPISAGPAAGPDPETVEQWTDLYFLKTKAVVEKFGDARVVYAVFMRRPVISAPELAIDWLMGIGKERGAEFKIDLRYAEGRWVGAGEPLMYISGSLFHLSDLETILLAKAGPGLRRRVQRLHHVLGPAAGRVPRHGCAPLRRAGDGGDHGLCRQRRLQPRAAQGQRRRLHRQRHARDRALFRQDRRWAPCRMR